MEEGSVHLAMDQEWVGQKCIKSSVEFSIDQIHILCTLFASFIISTLTTVNSRRARDVY